MKPETNLGVVWKSKVRAFTLVELLVVIAIIGILIAILLPAVQAARESARRAQCQANQKNVSLALLNYENSFGGLPPATVYHIENPTQEHRIETDYDFLGNWAISILPFIEQQSLFDAFDFTVPISDPLNIEERGTEVAVFLCPSDSRNRVRFNSNQPWSQGWARGNYAGNVGGLFLNSKHFTRGLTGVRKRPSGRNIWNENPLRRGVMRPNFPVKLSSITDGTSKTMMIAEVLSGYTEHDPRGVWAFGQAAGNLLAAHGAGGDDNGPNNCFPFADDLASPTRAMCADIPENACMPCYQNGSVGEFGQATSRSAHPGGVHVGFVDGSVRFVTNDIETSGLSGRCCTAWDHMIASADAEDPSSLGQRRGG